MQFFFHILKVYSNVIGDINSRHPVILGLRNILKTACSYDVTMITIPLFLTHEMTEVTKFLSMFGWVIKLKYK